MKKKKLRKKVFMLRFSQTACMLEKGEVKKLLYGYLCVKQERERELKGQKGRKRERK